MKLEDFGYNENIQKLRSAMNLEDFHIGRVSSQHKNKYIVKTEKGDVEAEITGNLRYAAQDSEDYPAVGDWVLVMLYDASLALIHKIIPRQSIISRKSVGQQGKKQVIATNIDYALIVQAVDNDFNINRMERYLTLCYSSNVKPIIVLNKIDLIDTVKLESYIVSIEERIKKVPIVAISNKMCNGIVPLKKYLKKGITYCLLGSSGVGKSTLTNNLFGKEIMLTKEIRLDIDKGKHTTTHRELIVSNDGILIDMPGMKEVGMIDASEGIHTTFETVIALAKQCKFSNCTHTSEVDCAILEAIQNNTLEQSVYDNYVKIEKEKMHFELSIAEKRKKDKKFGKMVKQIKYTKKRTKY
ncbi:ribosome small subunit-dependent GTPase A [Kordia sp.]|uniref:ribosome small subunit-dependent GTPase A n=1 Tax=Kordia sp. TaxID=1965332 RepID=UPI003B5AE891